MAVATIEIELNGEPKAIAAGTSVADLMQSLAIAEGRMAVAVNREVVPRGRWPERLLSPRDRVDVVRAIGGG